MGDRRCWGQLAELVGGEAAARLVSAYSGEIIYILMCDIVRGHQLEIRLKEE
ncbi:MAG: hypothetical protein LBU11_08285 [Zoogloeaceae bacterium]|nr:hypothetical protein [Zoogloeaceae bacterium]